MLWKNFRIKVDDEQNTWWHERLSELERRLGHLFHNREILEEALTHSSYAHEHGLMKWNERLEFLGDAVLELIVSDIIFRTCPLDSEGTMSRERASSVCETALIPIGRSLGLERTLRVGRGLLGNVKDSMLADAVEALIGALYIDGGIEASRSFWISCTNGADVKFGLDAKSRLQILCQSARDPLPSYEQFSVQGPDHAPVFYIRLMVRGFFFEGKGPNRKAAEQNAAEQALSVFQ